MRLGRRGYTMVEIAVGTMLTAVIAGSVFSLALTTKRSSGRTLRRMIADQASRQLSEQLRYYVRSPSYASSESVLDGPNWGTNWSMAYGTVTDDCGGGAAPCYALQTGSHTLTNYLPAWFESAPFNARIGYWVTTIGAADATFGNALVIGTTVQWNEL